MQQEVQIGERHLIVDDYALSNGRVHLYLGDGSTIAHGAAASLVAASRRLGCAAAATAAVLPAGFCVEQKQWAVNFGSRPVFGNTILTQGIAFQLQDENGRRLPDDDAMGPIIREAFGTAITVWMSALQDHLGELPPVAREKLSGMIGRSPNGYLLLTPPQVVRVGCPDSATFVVRYARASERALVNADGTDPKAARAEVVGRTLLINGVRYRCWKAITQQKLVLASGPQGRCLNLVPILVHELGHAFGLPGHVDGQIRSIMDSAISEDLIWPTRGDALALAAILLKPIQGSVMGRLDADGRGVSVEPRKPRVAP